MILGTARTGSSLLWSYLNSHPDILCMRGVFGSTNKINFGKYYQDLDEEVISPELVRERNKHPVQFIEKYVFKPYSKPYNAVGFKFFYNHNRHLIDKDAVIDYFIKNQDIKFIHLKRRNLLATLYSYKKSLAQNKWTTSNSDFQIQLSIVECEGYFHEIKRQQERFDNLFADRTLQIIYEDLIVRTYKILSDIQEFVGVSPANLLTDMVKNENKELRQVITNFDELQSHFKESEFKGSFD